MRRFCELISVRLDMVNCITRTEGGADMQTLQSPFGMLTTTALDLSPCRQQLCSIKHRYVQEAPDAKLQTYRTPLALLCTLVLDSEMSGRREEQSSGE